MKKLDAQRIGDREATLKQAGARSLSPDEHRWAEALKVEQIHGDHAPIFIAERIGALALDGDMAGVERWKEIAARLDLLRGGPRQ